MYKSASFCGLIMRLNRRGESLVELVVAMALFAVVVPSLYFALESAMRINLYSDSNSDATYLAQAELERIDALAPKNTKATVFSSPYVCNTELTQCEKTVGSATYVVVISDLDASTSINSVLLHVTQKEVTASLQLYIDFGE